MMNRYFCLLLSLALLGCQGENLVPTPETGEVVVDPSPSPTVTPIPTPIEPVSSLVFYESFNTGWGHFLDGGLYASLVADVINDSNVASVFGGAGIISSLLQRMPMDLTNAESISLQLLVRGESITEGDALIIDLSDGNQWQNIARVELADSIENQEYQQIEISVSSQEITFTDSARIRLTGETVSNRIFVDDIFLSKVSFFEDEMNAGDEIGGGTPFNHAGTEGCVGCHENRIAVGKSASHLQSSDECRFCHIANNPDGWTAYSYTSGTYDHTGVTDRCVDCHNMEFAAGKPGFHIESSSLCENCHAPMIGGWHLFTPGETFWHDSVSGECVSCHNGSVADGKGEDHIPSSDNCEECHTPNLPWSEVSL